MHNDKAEVFYSKVNQSVSQNTKKYVVAHLGHYVKSTLKLTKQNQRFNDEINLAVGILY